MVSTTGYVLVPSQRVSKISVVAAVAGIFLEFYDFTTYTFFAVMIGEHYFPAKDPFVSLILSVATFGVGFITRPIGGIVVGGYADRAGRRPAMILTVGLMAMGTLIVALTPSYATIGPLAPILVVLARLMQGFALGGEVGPATSFLLEAAPPGKRGLYASWQLASQGLSTLLAGAVGVFTSAILSTHDMQDWGWRVPFLLGLLVVPVAVFIRRMLPETLDLHAPMVHQSLGSILSTLIIANSRPIILAFALISSGTIGVYILNYMTTYAITTLHMPTTVSLAATLVLGVCILLFSLIGGWLSDKVGRKPLLIVSGILFILGAYPGFILINEFKNATALLAVTAYLAASFSLGAGVALTIIPESLPKPVRSAGLGISYALGVTLFGGTAQLVVAWLIHLTDDPLSPAWYLIASSIVGLMAVLMMAETFSVDVKV
jgi:MFS family permease